MNSTSLRHTVKFDLSLKLALTCGNRLYVTSVAVSRQFVVYSSQDSVGTSAVGESAFKEMIDVVARQLPDWGQPAATAERLATGGYKVYGTSRRGAQTGQRSLRCCPSM
jgi:hypothetical protein